MVHRLAMHSIPTPHPSATPAKATGPSPASKTEQGEPTWVLLKLWLDALHQAGNELGAGTALLKK